MVVPVVQAANAPELQHQKHEAIASLKRSFPGLSPASVEALLDVPRQDFIVKTAMHRAYEDKPLPIGNGSYTLRLSEIGFLLSELDIQSTDTVLEVGTGTGYLTAILAKLANSVYSLENNEYLRDYAYDYFRSISQKNVHIKGKNGLRNWQAFDEEEAEEEELRYTFDVILITAAISEIPEIILRQLNPGARLAVPMVGENSTEWVVYHWNDQKLEEKSRFRALVELAKDN